MASSAWNTQGVLYNTALSQEPNVYRCSSIVPVHVVVISLLWITTTAIFKICRKARAHELTAQPSIHSFRIGCAVGNTMLFALSVVSFVQDRTSTSAHWLITFTYAFFLATLTVFGTSMVASHVLPHLIIINLAAWLAYGYRDVWPLMTFALQPKDAADPFLWIKVAILTASAVFIPLVAPRQHVPVDLKVFKEAAPQQTVSLLSLWTYQFVTPIVLLAYRAKGHMGFAQLPPLQDCDHAEYLRTRTLPHVDRFYGAGKGHIFWGLFKVFRRDYMIAASLMFGRVFSAFAAPAAINRLLNSMETGGRDAVVRPWVWILLLLCGPLLGSLLWQRYMFYSALITIRMEAIVTTVVFEHSLRVRMKAETGKSTTSKDGRPQPTKKTSNIVGKLTNLVSSDLANITTGRTALLSLLIDIPGQIIVAIVFLHAVLGWSAYVGFATMAIMSFVPAYIVKLIQVVQRAKMGLTDVRVQAVSQIMTVLRMVKLFGWEKSMSAKVGAAREAELTLIKRRQLLHVCTRVINTVIPVVVMLSTYATFTLVMKQELTASRVFSSMTVFDLLREHIRGATRHLTGFIQAKVSLDRLNDFMHNTELLDQYDEVPEGTILSQTESDFIGFSASATFSWENDLFDGSLTPSSRAFRLRFEKDLHFLKGGLNLVIGPTGCGKSSLLMALLGEMHFVATGPDAGFSLPRAGGISYAAQESWVQNQSIRENVVFGSPFDEVRYKKVIYQCGLERDLSLFEAGDQTEVGEKGLTLSGGQKARVTLARAVYSSAEIILLDDVLAALDVHTARWIIDKCFTGDLVRGRTIIMVTHNVAMCAPISNFVVALGTDGRVSSQGSISDALARDARLAKEADDDEKLTHKGDDVIDDPEPSQKTSSTRGKLVVAEEIEVGHVSLDSIRLYLSALSGDSKFLFWVCLMGSWIIGDLANISQTRWLGHWADQYESPIKVSAPYYIGIYTIFVGLNVVFAVSGFVLYLFGTIKASRSVHKQLIDSVLGTTLRWLDITPTARILSRVTQDITAVDGSVAVELQDLLTFSTTMTLKLAAVAFLGTPFVIIPGIVIGCLGTVLGQLYLKAQLAVKREMSNARSPVLSQFGASVSGLISIRAYGAQDSFKSDLLHRIDHYSRMASSFYNLNRWVTYRIDAMSAVFASSLAAYLVYVQAAPTASNTGFSLNIAVGFSSMIIWWVRTWNEFEIAGNSLERIHGFIKIEQEPKNTPRGVPPAAWPTSGSLRVEKLSARYSSDGPEVLKNCSFEIKSGERVGIVGRTGSGKSSLTLALLRCILTEGTVYYDGIATSSLNLDALRENVTIIPQVPELLSGSLRSNLDPFDEHSDAVLNDALRSAGLFSLQVDMEEEGKITLDSAVSSGGGNLSVGQRQILALARAIVRKSKLLILDEATSAIDYKTDTVIQDSLRNELPSDVTLLTVAHRLQTIMDADKIMVLDAGRIVEFASPQELLKKEKGYLRALVDESGDKDQLYIMARAN